MTWTLVQSASVGATTVAASRAATFTNPVGSGNLVVGVGTNDHTSSHNVSTVVDDQSNSYTSNTVQIVDTTNGQNAYAFALTNITNGPKTVTVTFSASSSFSGFIMEEWSNSGGASAGIDVRTGQFQTPPGAGTDAITSGSVTTTVNGDLVWSGNNDATGTNAAVAGTGYTGHNATTNTGTELQTEALTQSTAGAIAGTWTANGHNDAQVTFVIAFKPPVAGGGSAENVGMTGLYRIARGPGWRWRAPPKGWRRRRGLLVRKAA